MFVSLSSCLALHAQDNLGKQKGEPPLGQTVHSA